MAVIWFIPEYGALEEPGANTLVIPEYGFYSGAPAEYSLTADSGSYTVTGESVAFGGGRSIHCNFVTEEVNLFYDHCDDIDPWTDCDQDGGISELVTLPYFPEGHDSHSFFSFKAHDSNDVACRSINVGAVPAKYRATFDILPVSIGPFDALGKSVGAVFNLELQNGNHILKVVFAQDGLFIYNGPGSYAEVGTNIVAQNFQQEFIFDVDATNPSAATCDVYWYGVLVASGVDCSYAAVETQGLLTFFQEGPPTFVSDGMSTWLMSARIDYDEETYPDPNPSEYNVAGSDVDFDYTKQLTAGAGSFVVSPKTVDLNRVYVPFACSSGSYSWSGSAATFLSGKAIDVEDDIFYVIGSAATFDRTVAIACGPGAFNVTGSAINIRNTAIFHADGNQYNVSGMDILLRYGRALDATLGLFNIVYSDTAVLALDPAVDYAIVNNYPGRFDVIGTPATLEKFDLADYVCVADYGVFQVAYSHTALLTFGEFFNNYILNQSAGRYDVIGTHLTLKKTDRTFVVADPGSFVVSEDAASLQYEPVVANMVISNFPGQFDVSGASSGLRRAALSSAGAGSYDVLGTAAALFRFFPLTAGTGAFLVSGSTTDLPITNRTLAAGSDSYWIYGKDLAFKWGYAPPTEEEHFHQYRITGLQERTGISSIPGRSSISQLTARQTGSTIQKRPYH